MPMTNNQKWTCSIAEEDVLIPPDSVQPEDFVRIVPVLWQGEVDRLSTKATGRRAATQSHILNLALCNCVCRHLVLRAA